MVDFWGRSSRVVVIGPQILFSPIQVHIQGLAPAQVSFCMH